jgi:biopolymer transport protein ExbD
MFRIRREDRSARLEMTPLIDVVFLLLTFFIYSFVVMVDARVAPMRLTPLTAGGPRGPGAAQWVSIDAQGSYAINREPVKPQELDLRLLAISKLEPRPTLYVVVESQSPTNLWPPFLHLFDRARAAGLQDITIVGRPAAQVLSEKGGPP